MSWLSTAASQLLQSVLHKKLAGIFEPEGRTSHMPIARDHLVKQYVLEYASIFHPTYMAKPAELKVT